MTTDLCVAFGYRALVLAVGGIALAACASSPAPDRTKELAACQLISKSGDELARCLIMKYSWGADSAAPAKYAWQRELDSIRLEHEAQAAAVLAAQLEEEERALRRQMARDSVRQVRIAQIDSLESVCMTPAFKLLVGGNDAAYQAAKAQCIRERHERQRRYGLPIDTL